MSNYEYKPVYERQLPHIQPPGATLFVTFRLAGSMPQAVIEKLKSTLEENENRIRSTAEPDKVNKLVYGERKRHFARYDNLLDKGDTGPLWLSQPKIAQLVADSIHFRNEKEYDLIVYSIMSNHVHMVITPLNNNDGHYHALQAILHSLKRYTAREANKLLAREGAFWQHESYDHVVRDLPELQRIISYVLENPVKVGLVDRWQKWPWSYLKPDLDL